jgi:hypothetical protein
VITIDDTRVGGDLRSGEDWLCGCRGSRSRGSD